jgi:hypothetical protein
MLLTPLTHLANINTALLIEQVLNMPWANGKDNGWAYKVNTAPDGSDAVVKPGANLNVNDPYVLLPEFENTPVGDALNLLGPVGGAYLRKLDPRRYYGAHSDQDDRYHLAITTNPLAVMMDFDNQTIHHMPVNGVWSLMDTGLTHTAQNYGTESRIHLHCRSLLPHATSGKRLEIIANSEEEIQNQFWFGPHDHQLINCALKDGRLTGLTYQSPNVILISIGDDGTVFDTVLERIRNKGFEYNITDF